MFDVGDAAPDVDDLLAVDVQRVARTDLAVLLEVLRERVAHALEAGIDRPTDPDAHDTSSLWFSACSPGHSFASSGTSLHGKGAKTSAFVGHTFSAIGASASRSNL